jgi:thymidine kinase
MSHLYFRYGTMGATKTRELLSIDYNYRVDNNLDSMIIIPSIADRDGFGIVKSRDGGERKADLVVYNNTNIYEFCYNWTPDIVLVDEAQFLNEQHIIQLARVVDEMDIPVIAYGLKNDFQNKLFEGSYYMLVYADRIQETPTTCRYCKSRATMVIRLVDRKPSFEGDQLLIGGNESYTPTCRRCYTEAKGVT